MHSCSSRITGGNTLLLTGLAVLLLAGCPLNRQQAVKPVIHFHDRHSLSYTVIRDTAKRLGALTLVLLDAHSDCAYLPGTTPSGITGNSWVGALLAEGAVKQVYWVPGNNFPVSRQVPEQVKAVNLRQICSLLKDSITDPLAVSLDLGILTGAAGSDPDLFLQEMLAAVIAWQPRLVTVALSAACQPDAQKAWSWFTGTYNSLAAAGTPVLDTGSLQPAAESREEAAAWEIWQHRRIDRNWGAAFAPGTDLWQHAPAVLWNALVKHPPLACDAGAEAVCGLAAGSKAGNAYKQLACAFPGQRLRQLIRIAANEVRKVWKTGVKPAAPPFYIAEKANVGIAVRFKAGRNERGCFAFYAGVKDFGQAAAKAALRAAFFDPRYPALAPAEEAGLEIEVSIFGAFAPADSALDFVPGADALLLETAGDRTLLQPSIALERNLSAYQFLENLTHKAGLAQGGWKMPGLRFYKAPVVSLCLPFHRGK